MPLLPPHPSSLAAECCTYIWWIRSLPDPPANKSFKGYISPQTNTSRRRHKRLLKEKGLRSRAWAGCGCSCSCRRHEVAGRRSIVILDRLPHRAWCLLGPLDVALNRDTIPNVQVIRPIEGIYLLILATVAGVLPSICNALIELVAFDLLAFDAPPVDHYSPTSSDSSSVTRLVWERNVIWR